MKKLIALASGIRLNAVLCGAAVLLSACGAGVTDPVNGQQSQSAAELTSSAGRPAANNAAAAPDGAMAAPTAADAAMAAAPAAAGNIEPAYDSNPQSARKAGFSDQTEAPAEAAQGDAPAACDTGTCQH